MAAISDRFVEIESAFDETEAALSDPAVLADPAQLAELGKRHADLKDVVAEIRRWRQASVDLIDGRRSRGRDPESRNSNQTGAGADRSR